MFKIFLFFFLFSLRFLCATLTDPGIEAATDGDPLGAICDCVSPLTGDFVAASEDLVIQGARPLRVHRIYVSGNSASQEKGWEFFPHLEIRTINYKKEKKKSKKFKRAVAREPNGTRLVFKRYDNPENFKGKKRGGFIIDLEKNGKGITNTSRGEISGRTNLRNYSLYQSNKERMQLTCADGTIRYYKYAYKDETKARMPVFLLQKEIHPDEHYTIYQYDKDHRLTVIANKSKDGKQTYAWCKFEYSDNPSKNHDFQIKTSDGRSLTYRFFTKKDIHRKPKYFLKYVDGPENPPESIQYAHNNDRVKSRSFPQGREILAEYYKSFEKCIVEGTSIETDHHFLDRRVKRVKTILQYVGKKGVLEPTHTFIYHCSEDEPFSTEVYDAYDNKTLIEYSSEYFPTQVTFFDSDLPHHSVSSEWDLQGQLLQKNIQGHDNITLSKKYLYDEKGNVLEEEILGNFTQINSWDTCLFEKKFDSLNRLIEKREPSGIITRFSYLENTPLVTAKFTSNEKKIHFREFFFYDHNNNLIQKIEDDGIFEDPSHLSLVTCRKIQRYHLKTEHPGVDLPEVIEEKALDLQTGEEILLSKVHLRYNKKCRVIQKDIYNSENEKSYSLFYKYDARGHVLEQRDPLGRSTRFEYDINGNLLLQTDPDKKRTLHAYDQANRLIEEKEIAPDGTTRITKHTYDLKNQRTATIDPFGNKTTYQYDPFGNVTEITHQDGATEKYTYDSFGNVNTYTDPLGNTTQKTHNSLGQPLQIIYPDESQETFTYTPIGKLETHTNSEGITIERKYDALGREIALLYYDREGEKIAEETFTYKGFHLISHTDKEGILTTYEYNAAGRKIAAQRGQMRTEYAYDTLGRLSKEIQVDHENPLLTISEYNFLNQLIQQTHKTPSGEVLQTISFTHDDRGNCISTQKEKFREYTIYDTFNRPICYENGEGDRTLISYDENYQNDHGQKVLRRITTDPLGYRSIDIYDTMMRPVSKTIQDPQNHTLSCEEYSYDLCGNCITQINHIYENTALARTFLITKTYDNLHRLTTIEEGTNTPDSKITAYSYTPCGKLYQIQKPDGTILTYTYDALSNLIELASSDNTIHYTYEYTLNSHLTHSHDHTTDTTTTRTYNEHGQILAETLANGLTTYHQYDDRGRRTQFQLPDDTTINYTYNPLYLTQVSALNLHATYSYDLDGNIASKTNIQSCQYQYDRANRPIQFRTPYFTQNIHYDERGHITEMLKENLQHTYTYDGLGQLLKERNHTYTYDSLYNRLSKDSETYQINTTHALTTTNTAHYEHDPNGNPILEQTPSSQNQYKYDALDRLIEIIQPDLRITYTYDSFNRRLTKTTYTYQNNSWTLQTHYKFLYDNQREIGAYINNNLQELRILGHSERDTLFIKLHNKIYIPTQDLQGNTIRLQSLDNTKTHTHTYSAFGEENPSSGNPNPWRYASKRIDPETNLIYFGHRYYNPTIGRWLTPDPSSQTDSPNLYAYTYNNPFLYIDAYGLNSTIDTSSPLEAPTWEAPKIDNSIINSYSSDAEKIGYFAFEDWMHDEYHRINDATLSIKYEPPPPALERSSIYETGGQELSDGKMIMTINGICTNYAQAMEHSRYISNFAGGANVHGVHAASYGMKYDLCRARIEYNNTATEPVRLLHQVWNNHFNKAGYNASILATAHSRGAIEVKLALLTYDKELRKRIYVIGIAPAAYIDPNTCGGVRHYLSKNDFVPKIDISGARKFASTIYTLDPHPNATWPDHGLESPTFFEPLRRTIEEYLKTGRIIK